MVYPDPKFLIFKKRPHFSSNDEEKLCQNKAILGKFLRFNLTDVVRGLKKNPFQSICLFKSWHFWAKITFLKRNL